MDARTRLYLALGLGLAVVGVIMARKVWGQTKGLRNNNPGNIRYTGTDWMGLDNPPQVDGFCRFTDAFFGLRAAGINALTIYERGARTLYDFGHVWAPPTDNNGADDYGQSLAGIIDQEGITARVRYPFTTQPGMASLLGAITKQENGVNPYPADLISRAATAALTYRGYL